MSSDVAAFEAEVKEYKLQLETVQSGLQADPDNAELRNLQTELEEVISLTETAIAELKPAAAPPKKKAESAPTQEKWSKENHPAYQAGYRKPEPAADDAEVPLAVNDAVMAKWKSGDKAFYPAKITAITGSATKPIYIVTFRIDGSTDTLMAHDLRPMTHESKKRKAAEGSTHSVPSAAAPATAGVISAAANINPALATQAKDASEPRKVSDGPPRPAKAARKVKANKELEAGKNKWQEFTMKGKAGKSGKKESMFRTGEGVNARVGFTGSGQEMRKDPTRSRHKYSRDAEDDY